MPLFSDEELALAHAKYLAENPTPKNKADIAREKAALLPGVVADFPDATAKELAEAAGMSPAWVRKHLRAAGITLAKARQRRS